MTASANAMDALTRAANYIDALGGDSKPYRVALAQPAESVASQALRNGESAEAGAVPAAREYCMSEAPDDIEEPNERAAWAVGADRGYADALAAAPASTAQAGMVGLTAEEITEAWRSTNRSDGYTSMINAALRTFCAKNGLALAEKREGASKP